MKMTPEQKAFYEYGRAVESFERTIQKIRLQAKREFGEPYHLLNQFEKKMLVIDEYLPGQIFTVRQKRAACRAWVPMEERYCNNCLHYKSPESISGCTECSKWADPINWEPRKEGE